MLKHRTWDVTPQDLEHVLLTSEKRPYTIKQASETVAPKGKSLQIKTMIVKAMEREADSTHYFDQYYNLIFNHPSGFGTGLPTYEWAFEVAKTMDELLNKPSFTQYTHIFTPK